jgi:hypothetical protein
MMPEEPAMAELVLLSITAMAAGDSVVEVVSISF